MKNLKKLFALAMTVAVLALCLCVPAMAAEEYTYTVTISAGGLDGAALNAGAVGGTLSGDRIVISGVAYGTEINLTGSVTTGEDVGYNVRGYVRSGHDYAEAVNLLKVTGDTDLVAAYSVPGQQVAYTVEYVDANGVALLESQTFFGTIGDMPVATYIYVEGYLPQALNLTKTLSENEAENIFTFVYYEVVEEVITTTTPAATTTVAEGGAAVPAAAEGAAAPDAAEDTAGELTEIQEDEVPLGQELVNLDEDDTPLSSGAGIAGNASTAAELNELTATNRKGAVIGGLIAGCVLILCAGTLVILKRKNV